MKWSIVGLLAVGILAALAAAVLVGALRANPNGSDTSTSKKTALPTILVAAKPLAAQAQITNAMVTTRPIDPSKIPANAATDTAQVLGKVLLLPMVEGEPFITTSFAATGSGVSLASNLPDGKRAVGVSVADYAGLEGILYPGCRVDVIASFRGRNGEKLREPVSVTLLEDVTVLAVERQTVGAENEKLKTDDPAAAAAAYGRPRKVTLLADVQQAKKLQLAQDLGTLALVLRGPKDTASLNAPPISLSTVTGVPESDLIAAVEPPKAPVTPTPATIPTAVAPPPVTIPVVDPPKPPEQRWVIQVIRGDKTETMSFPMPK